MLRPILVLILTLALTFTVTVTVDSKSQVHFRRNIERIASEIVRPHRMREFFEWHANTPRSDAEETFVAAHEQLKKLLVLVMPEEVVDSFITELGAGRFIIDSNVPETENSATDGA